MVHLFDLLGFLLGSDEGGSSVDSWDFCSKLTLDFYINTCTKSVFFFIIL